MSAVPGMGKVYQLGDARMARLLTPLEPVVVQEKIDGSQFSATVIEGKLYCRSRGQQLEIESPRYLFTKAVATFKDLHERSLLMPRAVYRGEAIARPKHNTLAYSRAPEAGIVLFDIEFGGEPVSVNYLEAVAEDLGLEVVPTYFEGPYGHATNLENLQEFLDRESVLGGPIEGVVIKARRLRDPVLDKPLMVKYVSADFKEKHTGDWKSRHPTRKDVVEGLVETYRHERRWEKSVERMRDAGTLTGTPADIGPLVREVQADIFEEEAHIIKEVLFSHFRKAIAGGVVKGLPDWYKTRLAAEQFQPQEVGSE